MSLVTITATAVAIDDKLSTVCIDTDQVIATILLM